MRFHKIGLWVLIIFFPGLISCSCNTRPFNKAEQVPNTERVPFEVKQTNRTRIIRIKENSVVFLIITQEKFDQLPEKGRQGRLDIIDDFLYYTAQAKEEILKYRIEFIFDTAETIIFLYSSGKDEKVKFNSKKELFKIILFRKDKSLEILRGIWDNKSLLEKMKKYFEFS